MDKSSVRRRPNNSATGQKLVPTTTATSTLHTKRTAGRSKCVGKASTSKDRANAVLPMVQPTNNNNNYSRCSPAGRERATARTAPPTMTRIGFGRSVTAAASAGPSGSGVRKGCATTPPAHLKPMAEAHKQLDLMLARVERGSDIKAAAPRRRKLQSAKVARVQGEPPQPPVPTVTPLSSARLRRYEGGMEDGVGIDVGVAAAAAGVGMGAGGAGGAGGAAHPIEYKLATTLTMAGGTTTRTTTMSTTVTGNPPVLVPLAQNPQRLTPEKRVALLKLLSRVEQRDQGMVQVLLSELNAATGDAAPTDGGMCRTHQRL